MIYYHRRVFAGAVGVCFLVAFHVAPVKNLDPLEASAHQTERSVTLPSGNNGGHPDMPGPLAGSSTSNIGTLAGRFSVSATGAAQYTIPIEVPPGRRGLQPNVSITYDSRVDDGHLGVGFKLNGVTSTIARCGTNPSNDGTLAPVRWSKADRLCLDGSRLVVKVGTYHAAHAEYRSERDNFTKIVQYGAPATHFLAYTKDGRILRYGDSDYCATCFAKLDARNGVVRAWALVEVGDRFGNYMTIAYSRRQSTYLEDYDQDGVEDYTGTPETMEYYPKSMKYTMKRGTIPTRELYFYYQTRNDRKKGWSAGIRSEQTTRLSRIRTLVDGIKIRDYNLAYNYSVTTGKSRLSSVTECAADGVCKPPTTFGWQGGTNAYTKVASTITAPIMELGRDPSHDNTTTAIPIIAGDYNGDGRTDLVYPKGMSLTCNPGCTRTDGTWRIVVASSSGLSGASEVDTGIAATWPFQGVASNYDDNASTDVLLLDNAPNWRVLKAGSLLFDTGVSKRINLNSAATFAKRVKLADFTGDGMHDVIACMPRASNASTFRWSYRLNTGNGFGAEVELPSAISSTDCRDDITLVLDANGDGAMDLLLSPGGPSNPTFKAALLTTSPASSIATGLIISAGGVLQNVRVVDVNGDGLQDLLAVAPGQGGNRVSFWTNRGGQFSGGDAGFGNVIPNDFGQYADSLGTSMVLDHDGDVSEDLFVDGDIAGMSGCIIDDSPPCPAVRSGNWEVLVNNGLGQLVPFDTGIPFGGSPSARARASAVDDNGDFLPDVVMVEGDVFKVLRHSGVKPDLVTRIRDGRIGLSQASAAWPPTYTVGITYKASTDATFYAGTALISETSSGCAYPVRCGNPMLMLVGYHYIDNGTTSDNTNRFDHTYLDARRDRKGRGFLGFGQHKIEEYDNNGSYTLLRYDNFTYDSTYKRYPFQSHLLKSTRNVAGVPVYGGRQFTISTYTPQKVNQGSSFFTYISNETTKVHELGSGPAEQPVDTNRVSWIERTRNVDTYGTPNVTSTRVDGVLYETLTNDNIRNDTANWLIGLPLVTSQTSYAEVSAVTRFSTSDYDMTTGTLSSTANGEGLTSTLLYDVYGNLTSTTVEAGAESRKMTVVYDSEGVFPYRTTNALGHATRQSFDRGHGGLLTELDPNLLVTRYSYDGFGRLRKVVRPDGTETTTDYLRVTDSDSSYHLETRVTTPGRAPSSAAFDRLGRVISTTDVGFLGAVVKTATIYDELGRVASQSQPYHQGTENPAIETYLYDGVGRLRLKTRPWGATVRMNYDNLWNQSGLSITTKDELGHWNNLKQNSLGQIVQSSFTTDALGQNPINGTMTFTYGAFGAPRTVVNAAGHVTSTSTDKYNRVLSVSDPNAGMRTFTYDAFGQRKTETDAKGDTTTFGYDGLGRLTSRSSGLGATWSYDTATRGIGKLAGATSYGTAESYTYDSYGRPNQSTLTVDGRTFKDITTYDSYGRVATKVIDVPSETQLGLTYAYDNYGRLTSLTNGDGLGTVYWTLNDVNARGRIKAETFGSGLTTSYGYHATMDRVSSISTPSVQNWAFEYDQKGNLFRRVNYLLPGFQWFSHDALDRLTAVQQCFPASFFPCIGHPANPQQASQTLVRAYAYDHIGNMTFDVLGGTHVYDTARPQLLEATNFGNTYAYDENGNTKFRPGSAGDMKIFYYTGLGKPSIILYNGAATSFFYTADLTRAMKQASGNVKTIYAFGSYEREQTGASVPVHRFRIQAGGRTVALISRSGSTDTLTYFHPDHLGSAEATTGSSGAIQQKSEFDPYGLAQSASWLGPVLPLAGPSASVGFTGHRHDTDLDLIDMRGRQYDAKAGRFLTLDPLVQAPFDSRSHNRFSYVWNNPLVMTDPTGYKAEAPPIMAEPDTCLEVDTCTVDNNGEEEPSPCDSDLSCEKTSDNGPALPDNDGVIASTSKQQRRQTALENAEQARRELGRELAEQGKTTADLIREGWANDRVVLDASIGHRNKRLGAFMAEETIGGLAGGLFGSFAGGVVAKASVRVAGGAVLEYLPARTRAVIQAFANKYGLTVSVVGSRARGTASPLSDFDYVITGANREGRRAAERHLPRGLGGGGIGAGGRESGIDVLRGPLDPAAPSITFFPE
jgi:RHS repeat-associated protein